MNGGAFRRIVEAFFRRWPFYVLLLVAAMALGFRSVSNTTQEYTSSGAIFVDAETLVTAQSGVQDGGFLSYLTPAQFTSQELGGLVSTDVFMESVLESAGVELPADAFARSEQLRQLRGAITTSAFSESLVQVSVTTPEPELSSQLALATIDEFVQFQISVSIAESGASEAFFTDLVADYQQDLIEARREVNSALRGVENLEDLTPEDQLELERLQEAEVLAAERFRAAVEDVEASRLAMLQTETDVRQRLSTFDPPQVPTEANGSFLDDLTVLAMFGMVGLMIALLGPVISALLSRGVLFADDLDLGPDTRVIGVIPRVRRKTLKLDQVEVVAETADISFGPVEQRAAAAAPAQPVAVVGQTVQANGAVASPAAGAAWSAPANGAVPAAATIAPVQPLPNLQPGAANGAAAQPTVAGNGAANGAAPAAAQPGVAPGAAAQAEPQAAVPRWARPVDATSELPISAKTVPVTPTASPSGTPTSPPTPTAETPGKAAPGVPDKSFAQSAAAGNGTPVTPAATTPAATPGVALPGTAVAGAAAAKPAATTPGAGFDDDLGTDFDDDLDDEDELSGNVVKVDPTRRTHA